MNTITQFIPTTVKKNNASPARKRRSTEPSLTATTTFEATFDRIRARAYEIFQGRIRDGRAGDETSDWLQAEREIYGSLPDSPESMAVEVKTKARGEVLLASGE